MSRRLLNRRYGNGRGAYWRWVIWTLRPLPGIVVQVCADLTAFVASIRKVQGALSEFQQRMLSGKEPDGN